MFQYLARIREGTGRVATASAAPIALAHPGGHGLGAKSLPRFYPIDAGLRTQIAFECQQSSTRHSAIALDWTCLREDALLPDRGEGMLTNQWIGKRVLWPCVVSAAVSLSGCGLAVGLVASGASAASAKSQQNACNDLTPSGIDTELGKKLAGQVVFTTEAVPAGALAESQLVRKVQASDALVLHAFLPKPFAKFCTGPYGYMASASQGTFELAWLVDGKPWVGTDALGTMPVVASIGPEAAKVATAFSLPLAVPPASYSLDQLEHPYQTVPRAHWSDLVATLPAGEHTLQVQVWAKRGAELRKGRSSVPLAVGELTVVSRGVGQGMVLPMPQPQASKPKQEAQMLALLKEIWPDPPLKVVLAARVWTQQKDRYGIAYYTMPVWVISKRPDGGCAAYGTSFIAWSLSEQYAGGLKLQHEPKAAFGPQRVACGK